MPDQHILIADDETDIREMLASLFEEEGFRVSQAKNGAEVLAEVKKSGNNLDLIMMDVRMPDMDGLTVLKQLKDGGNGNIPVLIMTAYGSSGVTIKAMQQGAEDFLTKPFDDPDAVVHKVNRIFEHQNLTKEVADLKSKLTADPGEKIIGNSGPMQEIYKQIGKVAGSDATVLISGETGTGKELIANVIHTTSRYSRGPLIKVNCAALPETLLESELFGHEMGAFTGAAKMRKGRFEMADKGSIFLDEVGEMTLSTQRKLLRVLQERMIDRLGGTIPIKIDVRVISATNRDLEQEIEAGKFRADLFFRLNVISIHMPALRDRKDDIPLLVEHFLDKHRYTQSSAPAHISREAMETLMDYDWPGNVRELENSIQRAVVDARGGTITSRNFMLSGKRERVNIGGSNAFYVDQIVNSRVKLEQAMSSFEKMLLMEALRQAADDEEAAAEILGITIRDMQQRMRRHR
ncbi:MAG: sigma-54-dependent Fis family transcriptional regulator [Chloroflexi bacterium]|nr:sigma-54-dependent Fis family transcriptional regulator [Chloroflexota bacterium]OJV94569.1 MAG: two-component system response regulator [Chloroflexi bacterium 54-19]